jgi:predicted DCC family thiol-disulfide oxidoreductase YuxK
MGVETMEPIIIAFDGECLMCSRTIRWVAERDHRELIRFTRLQDPIGKAMIAQSGEPALDSMLVRLDDRILARSSAVVGILDALGGFWKLPAFIGRLIPRPMRDWLYNFIARHRYQWFGKGDACSMPSEALTRRLLSSETPS